MFARQVLTEESEIQGEKAVQDAAKGDLWAWDKIKAQRSRIELDAQRRPLSTQTLSERLIEVLSNQFPIPLRNEKSAFSDSVVG